jgi:hypothetical protein
MATNGKGTGIVGYNGKKGRSAWRIRSASGRRGRGVEFAPDSLLEEGVTCELVSGNPDFNVRKKENGRPKAKFDQYLDLV